MQSAFLVPEQKISALWIQLQPINLMLMLNCSQSNTCIQIKYTDRLQVNQISYGFLLLCGTLVQTNTYQMWAYVLSSANTKNVVFPVQKTAAVETRADSPL